MGYLAAMAWVMLLIIAGLTTLSFKLQSWGCTTVSVGLRAFSNPGAATDWGAIFVMLVLSLVPVFLLFVFFQRHIVEGIATTGLKG